MWNFVTGMVYSIRFMGAVRILFVGGLDCVCIRTGVEKLKVSVQAFVSCV